MGELDVSRLMSVGEAIGVIDSVALEMRVEQVSLARSRGYSLAEDVIADRDYPPFDKSLMDGFAIGGLEREAKIIGEIAAGGWSDFGIKVGEAMAIMTGAPIPPRTQHIVPIENVEVIGNQLRILEPSLPGQYIAKRGSDVRAGEIVLRKGQTLQAAQLAVAASVGKTSLSVYSRPRVGVLSTGDEIVPPERTPGAGQIRDSNSIMLTSLLQQMDCHVLELGHVRDEKELIAQRITLGMANVDVLFISGGMSMGRYDYAPQVLQELGVELLITKVRIKPGKPFLFGKKKRAGGGECFVFGLPGNPVSAMICTLRLAGRLLRRMQGRAVERRWMEATLINGLPANGPREFYQPVRLQGDGVMPLAWKGSADIFTLAQADALLRRAENEPAIKAGARVRVMAIR
jgi:molybdopterin molybdotransferase